MKKNELKILREKETRELWKLVGDKKNELLELLAKPKTGSQKNLKKGKNIKREIAQTLTVIKEKEISEKEGHEVEE